MATLPIHGPVAPAFKEVEQEFHRNFTERGEIGAACAIWHDGEMVVDLWGGRRDAATGEPWDKDTLVVVFSTSKGVSAMVMAVAHSRGCFEMDRPVAHYWPEFAQSGKEAITIRQLLAFQAGLSALDEAIEPGMLADLDAVAAAIARQAPAWEPGTRHGYHPLSLGFYQNELIRRTDSKHRSLGTFLQDEIARPLGIELYIGLPREVGDERVAAIKAFSPLSMLLAPRTMPPRLVLSMFWPWSLAHRAMTNPRLRGPGAFNTDPFRRVEFPSATGIGNARALARAYGAFATGGGELGLTAETTAELTAAPRSPTLGSRDMITTIDTSYAFGFVKPFGSFQFGSSGAAFGCPGAGGSFGFADPDARLGFGYVMNRMGMHIFNDPREKALRDACYRCLRAPRTRHAGQEPSR